MNENDYVIFKVDSCSLALPSGVVDKVERAVMLTPVPDAPAPVLGVVNDGGDVVPVLGLRSRIGSVEREVIPSDRLLFSVTGGRRIAILADDVSAVTEIPAAKFREVEEIWPGVLFLRSFAGVDEGIVMLQDLGAVLDPEQEIELGKALKALAAKEEADG